MLHISKRKPYNKPIKHETTSSITALAKLLQLTGNRYNNFLSITYFSHLKNNVNMTT